MGNTIKWGIASSAMNSFTGAVQKSYSYVQKLDKSLNDIRIVSNQTAKDMERFAIQANNAAAALGATTLDYTNASLIFYQQGLAGDAVAERADAVVKMTNVTGDAADKVSSYMTAVWNNFADGSKELEYYADVMTALGAATASSTQEIADGLEKFASIADTVGLSYEYATSALATVVAETRQSADVVGTAFKTLFARIQGLNLGETLDDGTTLNKYSEALGKVGISIKDQNGDLKDMDDILNELGSKWETLNKDQQVALAQTVAGVRQYNQLVALMDNWDKMQENLATAADSAGTLQAQQDTYMESLEGHINQLTAAEEHLYDAMFDSDSFKDLLDMLTGLVNGMGDFVDAIGGGGNALMLLGSIATNIFDKKIAQGLTNIINNSKIASTNLKNLTDQNDALKATYQEAELHKNQSPEGAANFEGTKVAVSEHNKMMEYTDILTPDQIEEGNNLIRVYSDAVAKVEELNLKQQEAAKTAQELLQFTDKETYGNTDSKDFQDAIGSGQDADQIISDFNGDIENLEKEMSRLQKSASKSFDVYQKGGDAAADVEEDLQNKTIELKKELERIEPILGKNLQEKIKNLDGIEIDFKSKDFEKQCDEIVNLGEEAFNELEAKDKQINDALINSNNNAIKVAEGQMEGAKTSLSQ